MPTTSRYALRYPAGSDTPNGPAQIQALATDVETALGTIDDAGGYVGETIRTTQIAGAGATEVVLDTLTFTANSARRYKVTATVSAQSGAADDSIVVRLRWKAGVTLDSAGTEFGAIAMNADVISKGQPITIVRTISGISGTVTLGSTGVRNSGSGTITFFASSVANAYLLVEAIN